MASLLLVLLPLLALSASAQETLNNASITGRVTGASSAVIAKATVTVPDNSTNTVHATTDANGRYRFPYLPVNEYEVMVHQAGIQ